MRQYVILLEKGEDGYGVFSPALPGCVSFGKTRQEAIANMHEAIGLHLDSMALDGEPIPDEDLEAVTLVVPEPNPAAVEADRLAALAERQKPPEATE